MNIALDISPLQTGHAARGVGSYTRNLREALEKYFPSNNYLFFKDISEVGGNIDLIHYPYFDPFFITLPLKKRKKTVVTIHDLIPVIFPKHFPAGIKGRLRWHAQRLLLKKVDGVIVDSLSTKKDVLQYTSLNENKVHVVYLGASSVFEKKQAMSTSKGVLAKYSLPDKFLLYVGDATWNKNMPHIIEAALLSKLPLVMVGKSIASKDVNNNPWNKDLLVVQRFIDGKSIIALGFVSDEDLLSLYKSAHALLMPSYYEGFGLPVLEAMTAGCPVITAKSGSLPEVAGNAALYVDPKEVNDIVKTITTLSQENVREAYIEKGLLQARKFSWRKTAQDTLRVYQQILQ